MTDDASSSRMSAEMEVLSPRVLRPTVGDAAAALEMTPAPSADLELVNITAVSPEPFRELACDEAKVSLRGKRRGRAQYKALKEEIKLNEHTVPLETLCDLIGVNPEQGLSSEEAKRKLDDYGRNQLTPPKSTPEIIKFIKQLTGFFSLLLWAGSILSGIAYGLDSSDKSNLWLCIVLAAVVLLTGCFTYWQERQSSNVMARFRTFLPTMAKVLRNGELVAMDARELVPGDVVRVKAGDKVPADIRIIHSNDFHVDNSSLTGESEPVLRTPECTSLNPLESGNLAFYGTLATDGEATGIVILTGDHTVIGRIARLTSSTGTEATGLHKEISRFIVIISVVAFVLGAIFLTISLFIEPSVIKNVVFTIGIIVANVPEGLLATVTVSLTLTAKRMAKRNVLVKNLEAVETLGSTTVIASDKTGTLTQNKMTVAHVWFDRHTYSCETTTTAKDYDAEAPSFKRLLQIMGLCSNATFNPEDYGVKPLVEVRTIGDASESAIIKFADPHQRVAEMRVTARRIAEVPFNSLNKYHIVLLNQGGGSGLLMMKGASERIVDRCTSVLVNGETLPMTDEMVLSIGEAIAGLAGHGERVLGFAERTIDNAAALEGSHELPDQGYTLIGLAAMIDPPKAGVKEAVAKCKSAGIKVIMVTGDHPLTARAIATQVGILTAGESVLMDVPKAGDPHTRGVVIQGHKLNNLTEEDWDRILEHREIVFARTSPQQKLVIVEHNQRLGQVVAVTGDGVNDAPALKKADIGISMGISGSDVSKEAADMILLDDNFASLVNGVEEGRLIFDNLKKSIAYTLSSNIPEIVPFLAYAVLRIPQALTTVLILCIDLGTDLLPAISLAYEGAEKDIMNIPPRNRKKERLVSARLISFSYLQIGIIQALAGFATYLFVLWDRGIAPNKLYWSADVWSNTTALYPNDMTYEERKEALAYAQAAFFVSIVVTQVADVLICKTRRRSIFSGRCHALGTNRVLLIGIVEELVLACVICYVPGVNTVLGGRPIKFVYWLIPVPFSILIFVYDETRKGLLRSKHACGRCVKKATQW